MRFALVSTVPSVSLALLAHLAAVAAPELARVAAAWGIIDATITAPTVVVRASVAELLDGDTPVVFVAAFPPEDADDLAYHTTAGAQPYALVLGTGGDDQVTQGAFHEMAEALVDPSCSTYEDGLALEICDPVQNDPITRDGVLLSAWVAPAWFRLGVGPTAESDEGFDLAPGAIRPGGYVMRQDGTQEPPGYQRKTHASGRPARREAARARS